MKDLPDFVHCPSSGSSTFHVWQDEEHLACIVRELRTSKLHVEAAFSFEMVKTILLAREWGSGNFQEDL